MRWVSLRNCCFLEMTKKSCKMYHQICSMENNIRFWLFYLPFPFPLLLSKSMDICQEKKDTLMLFMMMWHDISIPPAWVCLLALEYIPTSGENHKKWPVMQTKSLFLPNPKNHKRRSCFPLLPDRTCHWQIKILFTYLFSKAASAIQRMRESSFLPSCIATE